MENEEMEKTTVNKLIEWLEKHGHTPEEIVECIKYITGKQNKRTHKGRIPKRFPANRPK